MEWHDVIRVAVINCGDDTIADQICKHADLKGYPTIKYLAPFSNTSDGDTGYNRDSYVSIDTIMAVHRKQIV